MLSYQRKVGNYVSKNSFPRITGLSSVLLTDRQRDGQKELTFIALSVASPAVYLSVELSGCNHYQRNLHYHKTVRIMDDSTV